MSNSQWHYVMNNQKQGPVDETMIQLLVQARTINASTLVWQEGMPDWAPLQNTPLQAIVPVPSALAAVPPAAAPGYAAPVPQYTAESFNQLFMWFWILLAASIPLSFLGIGVFTAIGGVVLMYILFYRFWTLIQDGTARTTPGKAVGYLFIPFYNFYWMFTSIYGLTQDMNRYCREKGVMAPVVNEQLGLWYCILTLAMLVPGVDLLASVGILIVGIMLLNNLTKTAVAIVNFKQFHR